MPETSYRRLPKRTKQEAEESRIKLQFDAIQNRHHGSPHCKGCQDCNEHKVMSSTSMVTVLVIALLQSLVIPRLVRAFTST